MEQQSPNERRLEDWMRTYGTAILRTCFVILSDAREAEDAMQDTFLRAWRAMDTFEQRNGASVKTWLMRAWRYRRPDRASGRGSAANLRPGDPRPGIAGEWRQFCAAARAWRTAW